MKNPTSHQSIPENDMLRVTLPHLLQDPLLAMLETTSGFYNLPEKLGWSFASFLRCVEPTSDSRSGYVLRRSAVDDIGGIPTRSSIEDKRLEAILKGRGYKTAQIDQVVQYSLIPSNLTQHLSQRVHRSKLPDGVVTSALLSALFPQMS